jgi:hypothetical protein
VVQRVDRAVLELQLSTTGHVSHRGQNAPYLCVGVIHGLVSTRITNQCLPLDRKARYDGSTVL